MRLEGRGRAWRRAAVACACLLVGGLPVRSAGAADFTAGGLRGSIGGALSAWHVFRLDPDTPRERPSTTLDLQLAADRGEHLHLFTALRAGFDGKIGDPDRGNPFLTPEAVYQDKDLFLALDEAYIDLFFRSFEVRLGRQKISWGQLDDLQPTDHLNPEDLSEFLFRPELERKIGIPAARVIAYGGPWTVDAVWAPFFTAYRFPDRDDRWFPPLITVPDRLVTPLGELPIRTRYPDIDPPPHTLASSDVGLRVTRFVRGAEVSATVFHGWDKSPTFSVAGTATVIPTGLPDAPAAPSVDAQVFPTLHRITAIGGDFAVPVWLVALRGELAWIHGRSFPLGIRDRVGSDPNVVATIAEAVRRVAQSGQAETVPVPLPPFELERDSLQYGLGVDFFVNEPLSRRLLGNESLAGTFFLLQLIETVIFDHDADFISDAIEHVLALTLRQSFRDERVLAEMKVVVNAGHRDYILWPQLTYKLTPNLHLLLEARVIGGRSNQVIGEFQDYDGIRIGFRHFL